MERVLFTCDVLQAMQMVKDDINLEMRSLLNCAGESAGGIDAKKVYLGACLGLQICS